MRRAGSASRHRWRKQGRGHAVSLRCLLELLSPMENSRKSHFSDLPTVPCTAGLHVAEQTFGTADAPCPPCLSPTRSRVCSVSAKSTPPSSQQHQPADGFPETLFALSRTQWPQRGPFAAPSLPRAGPTAKGSEQAQPRTFFASPSTLRTGLSVLSPNVSTIRDPRHTPSAPPSLGLRQSQRPYHAHLPWAKSLIHDFRGQDGIPAPAPRSADAGPLPAPPQ